MNCQMSSGTASTHAARRTRRVAILTCAVFTRRMQPLECQNAKAAGCGLYCMFAGNAPAAAGGVSRPGLCPAAPDPAAFADGVDAEELAEEVGKSGKYASEAIILTKMQM